MGVSLKAGDNLVVYTGGVQSASDAFASIISYLETAYYWNNVTRRNELVVTTTTMVPYGVYSVEVSWDCIWNYGADETPLDSVQLYAQDYRGANIVPYCGPWQPVEEALAPIWDYLLGGYYYDNSLKKWVILTSGLMMVPNTPYAIGVNRDCVWTFVAVVPEPEFRDFGVTEYVTV